MLELHQFSPAWGIPNISPFCIKVETYFRMAKIPFKIVIQNNPGAGPAGRLPFIKHEGKTLPDSTTILNYVKKTFGDPFDSKLTPDEKNQLTVYQHLFEDSLYWTMIYSRWYEPTGWKVYAPTIASLLPPGLGFIKYLVRSDMLKQMSYQGISERPAEEVYSIAKSNIEAISAFLGNKQYFLGDKISSLDAIAYGHLISILWAPFESPLKVEAKKYPNLEKFCQRMKSAYYSEEIQKLQKVANL